MRMHIKKGLDIPMKGKPSGALQSLPSTREVALNLDPFGDIRFKVLVKLGDVVKIGTPLVESKNIHGQMFASPAAGIVKEIQRGEKRRLLKIIIEIPQSEEEKYEEHGALTSSQINREALLTLFMKSGIFPYIRMRPFNLIANPKDVPRDIFVSAVETLPCNPPAEMQVEGYEGIFQAGLNALTHLTSGKVHLVYKEGSSCRAFKEARNVSLHTISGPHPAGNPSVHIHLIAPIQKPNDIVWTLSVPGVLAVGKMVLEGRYFIDRVISIAGEGIQEGKTGFFKARAGYPISLLLAERLSNSPSRIISGDPLIGTEINKEDFIGFYHACCSAIPENVTREPFHFLRLGTRKYSATGAYLSGHVSPPEEGYSFTTNQHGEERAFIDGAVYDRVMPMRIPTMFLVKAILTQDFELAEKLGILEIASEDFALPTFICPSKIEMIQIVKEGLHQYSKELGY